MNADVAAIVAEMRAHGHALSVLSDVTNTNAQAAARYILAWVDRLAAIAAVSAQQETALRELIDLWRVRTPDYSTWDDCADELEERLGEAVVGARPPVPQVDQPEEMWTRASRFIRGVIEAVGFEQPPLDSTIDLDELLLIVVGHIEELKVSAARPPASEKGTG